MALFDESKYTTKEDLFKFLKDNKDSLIAQKKAQMKCADGLTYAFSPSLFASKAVNKATSNDNEVSVTAVINTTNVMDSHGDVHINGLWDKSLRENKSIMHLQEHKMQFDKIISDGEDLSAYVKDISFKDLGYDLPGMTQALIFESKVKKERNPYMFDQYSKGNVRNHSVGMRYVKIVMAVNSDDSYYAAEKEVWDKYIEQVANKEEAEDRGYFWVVKEAKIIEGSAVPIGSNQITPTLEVKNEPEQSTQHKEPSGFDTLTKSDIINIFKN